MVAIRRSSRNLRVGNGKADDLSRATIWVAAINSKASKSIHPDN